MLQNVTKRNKYDDLMINAAKYNYRRSILNFLISRCLYDSTRTECYRIQLLSDMLDMEYYRQRLLYVIHLCS